MATDTIREELISFDEVEEWGTVVPAGRYLLEAYFGDKGTEVRTSKEGKQYLNLALIVRADTENGAFKGRRVYDSLHFSQAAIGRTKGLMKGILGDKMPKGAFYPSDLVKALHSAGQFVATVNVRPSREGDREQNSLTNTKPGDTWSVKPIF